MLKTSGALVLLASAVYGQPPAAAPRFEVASVKLSLSPAELRAAGRVPLRPATDPAGVDIFKSVEKLGLKLEKGKAPIEHIVVEYLEKVPTEN